MAWTHAPMCTRRVSDRAAGLAHRYSPPTLFRRWVRPRRGPGPALLAIAVVAGISVGNVIQAEQRARAQQWTLERAQAVNFNQLSSACPPAAHSLRDFLGRPRF